MVAYLPFRSRDYRFLLAGNMLSTFGLQMLSVAVSWDLYLATRSALVLGNVGLVQVAPFLLFALIAGTIADRYDRRSIMLVTQTLFLVASTVLMLALRSVAVIYLCLFLTAVARSFQWPARLAMLPHVVPADALRTAITWSSSGQEIASISGPALAGLLIAWRGSRIVYAVQLTCGVLAFLCYWRMQYRALPDRATPAANRQALLEGVRFVWNDKLILPVISLDLFAVLFGGATALLPIYAVDILHAGAKGLGWLRAAPSIGAVLMALTTAHAPKIHHAGKALLWAVAGFGAATVVFGLSRSIWLSFAMLLLTGAFDNVSVVLRQSLVQMETPDALRGRVLSVNSIFISCSNQLGAVESGWTAAWFGAIASVVAGGFATVAIVAAFAAKSKPLRRWQQ